MSLDVILSEYSSDDDNPLSKAARINIITQVLMRDDIEPYSRNQLLTTFREYGLGIRTQEFYDLYRDVRGINISSSAIRSVPDDVIPRLETFAPNRYKQQSEFLYVVEYSYLSEDQSTILKGTFGVSSDYRMSKQDLLEQFEDNATEFYPNRDFDFGDARVTRAFRRV